MTRDDGVAGRVAGREGVDAVLVLEQDTPAAPGRPEAMAISSTTLSTRRSSQFVGVGGDFLAAQEQRNGFPAAGKLGHLVGAAEADTASVPHRRGDEHARFPEVVVLHGGSRSGSGRRALVTCHPIQQQYGEVGQPHQRDDGEDEENHQAGGVPPGAIRLWKKLVFMFRRFRSPARTKQWTVATASGSDEAVTW